MQTDPVGYEDQVNLYAYVGNDPVNGTDPTGMSTENWEDDIYANQPRGNDCGCQHLLDLITQVIVQAIQRKQEQAMVVVAIFSAGMMNEDANDSDGADTNEVQEEYDSIEAAVGSVNPLDEVEYESKTKEGGLKEQGFTEKWTGIDSNGEYQSAFKNPNTGKWTGGHSSSRNNKYW